MDELVATHQSDQEIESMNSSKTNFFSKSGLRKKLEEKQKLLEQATEALELMLALQRRQEEKIQHLEEEIRSKAATQNVSLDNTDESIKIEYTEFMKDLEDNSDLPVVVVTPNKLKSPAVVVQHDCEKVDKENAELRRKFERAKKAFTITWNELQISNQRNEQIKKAIQREMYKTYDVLNTVCPNIKNVNNRVASTPLSKSASATITSSSLARN